MHILLIDNHVLLTELLKERLETQLSYEVTCVQDINAGYQLISNGTNFDLILFDYITSNIQNLDALTDLLNYRGGQKVALMSGNGTKLLAETALAAGAAGFLPKTLPIQSFVNALKFIEMGEQYAPIDFMTKQEESIVANPTFAKLSRRELQVLEGLANGKPNKEIARDLDLQEPTIKLHVKTLYRKIGAANRTQAALIAKEHGLF